MRNRGGILERKPRKQLIVQVVHKTRNCVCSQTVSGFCGRETVAIVHLRIINPEKSCSMRPQIFDNDKIQLVVLKFGGNFSFFDISSESPWSTWSFMANGCLFAYTMMWGRSNSSSWLAVWTGDCPPWMCLWMIGNQQRPVNKQVQQPPEDGKQTSRSRVNQSFRFLIKIDWRFSDYNFASKINPKIS
jgi:hypothetical protein